MTEEPTLPARSEMLTALTRTFHRFTTVKVSGVA
jgi:hypothetical protein